MKKARVSFVESICQSNALLLDDLVALEEAAEMSVPGLGARLDSVRADLLEHFRFEEQDGYMALVVKEEPHLQPAAQELLREHGQLARALDALIQKVRSGESQKETISESVRAWVAQVRQHEARENALVQEAYYSSGATGD